MLCGKPWNIRKQAVTQGEEDAVKPDAVKGYTERRERRLWTPLESPVAICILGLGG